MNANVEKLFPHAEINDFNEHADAFDANYAQLLSLYNGNHEHRLIDQKLDAKTAEVKRLLTKEEMRQIKDDAALETALLQVPTLRDCINNLSMMRRSIEKENDTSKKEMYTKHADLYEKSLHAFVQQYGLAQKSA